MISTTIRRVLSVAALAVVFATAVQAQDIRVSGTVTDADQDSEPMIGATVMQKGTSNGVATDLDGRYTLTVPRSATLVVSYAGYQKQEIPVQGRTTIDVQMHQTSASLDEVVVIGYGLQRKSDVTGSISSVSGKDVNNVPTSSALAALQGKAAGVNIIQNNGQPGAAATIKIRGTGTINDADPLYVVDGFIVDNIDYINPADIASIEILKDAASSAVYGSRAANGVVAITTRQGQEGKVKVTFDAYAGFANPWKETKVMDAEQYALMLDYAQGQTRYSTDGQLYMTRQDDGSLAFDANKKFEVDSIRHHTPSSWWDAVTRTGVKQSYAVSLSGGNDRTKYLVSMSYYNEKGIVKGSDYARFNGRVNLQQKLFSWLNVMANMAYTNTDANPALDGTFPLLKYTLWQSPHTLLRDNVGQWSTNHPVARVDRWHYNMRRDRVDMNLTLSADFLKYFNYQFKASYYNNPNKTKQFTEVNTRDEAFAMTSLTKAWEKRGNTDKWEVNNLLTFNWNDKHNKVTVLAGQTAEGYKYSYLEGTKKGAPSNDDDQQYISSGYTGDLTYGTQRRWTAVGFIGRVNYSFDDRYLLQANVRIDGSSMFAKHNRWGTFPSVSLGWKFSNEKFLNSLEWLTLGKLRAGWGKLGNNRIDELSRYTYLSNQYNYAYSTGNHVLQPGSTATVLGNPDIKWEKTETYNIGIDLAFMNNTLTLSAEYFDKRTSDILLRVPTVGSAGLDSYPMVNAGKVSNKGVEVQASYRRGWGKFSMEVGFNFSIIRNKVTSLGTGNEPIWGSYLSEPSIVDYITKTEVGRPIGAFYGYVTDGIFQNYEEVKASAQYEPGKMDSEQTTRQGDFRFKDLNGDGKITAEDRTYLGSPLPTFVFGIPLTFTYKNLSLNMFFQGQTGNKIFNVMDYYLNNAADGNCYADLRSKQWSGQVAENRAFFPLNTTAKVPDLDPNDAARNFRASDFLVHKGDYMRLKELRIAYSFPRSLLQRWGIEQLTLSATAYNLWTITSYNGLDPEIGKVYGTEGNNLSMGVDHGSFPQARSFTFGLSFTL